MSINQLLKCYLSKKIIHQMLLTKKNPENVQIDPSYNFCFEIFHIAVFLKSCLFGLSFTKVSSKVLMQLEKCCNN